MYYSTGKIEGDLRTDKERKAGEKKELEKMRYWRGGSEAGGGGWAEEQTGRGESWRKNGWEERERERAREREDESSLR